MTSHFVSVMARPWVSNAFAQDVLVNVHYAYPIILLAFFLAANTTHAVLTASTDEGTQSPPDQRGPGGKPLPRTASPKAKEQKNKNMDFSPGRKLFFSWISMAVILTFLANAVVVLVHALIDKKNNWWCGQSVVVRKPLFSRRLDMTELTVWS